MATTKKTPSSIWCNFRKILGPSKPLPVADLPTLRDTLLQVLLMKEGTMVQGKSRIFELVALKVVELWSRVNVRLVDPAIRVSHYALVKRIKRWWNAITALTSKKKKKPKHDDDLQGKLDKLFNILHCSCDFITCETAKCVNDKYTQVHIDCSCTREKKV